MKSPVWHQLYDTGVPTSLDYPSYPMDYFLKKTAAKHPTQQPKSVEFRKHLPKTAVGKILRCELMVEEKSRETK